jgi:hypothetical protein
MQDRQKSCVLAQDLVLSHFVFPLGSIRRVISASSFVKLEMGFPERMPSAIFFNLVIRLGSVVTLTAFIRVSAFFTASAAFVFISSVFLASTPGFISRPTKAVDPDTTTVADFTPSTFSAAEASLEARVWAAGAAGFGAGAVGDGVTLVGGAGLGAGFRLIEQPPKAKETIASNIIREEKNLFIYFPSFIVL